MLHRFSPLLISRKFKGIAPQLVQPKHSCTTGKGGVRAVSERFGCVRALYRHCPSATKSVRALSGHCPSASRKASERVRSVRALGILQKRGRNFRPRAARTHRTLFLCARTLSARTLFVVRGHFLPSEQCADAFRGARGRRPSSARTLSGERADAVRAVRGRFVRSARTPSERCTDAARTVAD